VTCNCDEGNEQLGAKNIELKYLPVVLGHAPADQGWPRNNNNGCM
jgi:hypothetical protein